MKKFAVLLIVAFVTALVVSSCNKEECPAYSAVLILSRQDRIG